MISAIGNHITNQLSIQQARRVAEQAEAAAIRLRSQAKNAEMEAERQGEISTRLRIEADTKDGVANMARQAISNDESSTQMQQRLNNSYSKIGDMLKPQSNKGEIVDLFA